MDYARDYYNPKTPRAFAGEQKFYASLKRTDPTTKKYALTKRIQTQQPYTGNKLPKRKFQRRTFITSGMNVQADADLCDVSNIYTHNDGTRFLLIVIDDFSRFAWAEGMEDKSGNATVKAFGSIFKRMKHRPPYIIRTDKGSEFKNRKVQELFRKHGVKHVTTQNEDVKAHFAERFIRTLKGMLYRYFTYSRTYRYLEILQDLVYNYNHRPHKGLNGRSPAKVDKHNEAEIWIETYGKEKPRQSKPFKFKKGAYVRVSLTKRTFEKGYETKWSGEVFKIASRSRNGGLPVYRVEDLQADPIEGTFYENELQLFPQDPEQVEWRVESVIKKRRIKKGKKSITQAFVKWEGFPKKFNQWIDENEIKDIT